MTDDSDEELGAYIYSTSRTAQLLREEAAARNNELSLNNDNDITRPKRKSPHEVENVSLSSEPKQRTKKKRKKYTCSNEGCTNYAQNGGVCIRHGAKVKRKTCKHNGCANQVQKGGVCIRHGAKKKKSTCSHEKCTNQAVRGGVCQRHGAKSYRKTCKHEGCTNQVRKGGVCKRHGEKSIVLAVKKEVL